MSSLLQSRNIKTNMNKITILPVVLYECKSWSLTLRENHRWKEYEANIWI